MVKLRNFLARPVVGVEADGNPCTFQRREFMADTAELALQVGELGTVQFGCACQFFLRDAPLLLQSFVGGNDFFNAFFYGLVIGKAESDFGATDSIQLIFGVMHPLPQDAHVLGALIGCFGEVA